MATDSPPSVTAPAAITVVEGQTLTLNLSASDADGDPITSLTADFSALPAGHGAVFTRNGSNTAGTLTWTPSSSAGRPAPYSVTFTAANERSTAASTAITVADAGSGGGANLCGNSGFEAGTAGWEPYGVATLNAFKGITLRVRGDGKPYALQLVTSSARRVTYRAIFATTAGEWRRT